MSDRGWGQTHTCMTFLPSLPNRTEGEVGPFGGRLCCSITSHNLHVLNDCHPPFPTRAKGGPTQSDAALWRLGSLQCEEDGLRQYMYMYCTHFRIDGSGIETFRLLGPWMNPGVFLIARGTWHHHCGSSFRPRDS